MHFSQLKKSVLLLVLAAMMLLSACKVVVMDEVPESTKRTKATTTESTKRTTTAKTTKSKTTTETTPEDVDVPAVSADTEPTWATEAPVEIPEESEMTEPDIEVPALRVDFEEMSLLPLEDRFFLCEMAEESMDVFQQVYRAAMTFEREVVFDEPITIDRMSNVMMLINYACPEIMQIDCDYTYYTNGDGMCVSVEFHYLLNEDTYLWALEEIRTIFEELRRQTRGMSDYEKEQFAYELLIDVCTYDVTTTHSGTCYGAMLEGVARCEGYAKSFMWMMWALDIPCMTVTGDILADGERHSWNIVEINGVFGHVDATHDDVERDGEQCPVPYGFFNVSDAVVDNNRTTDRLYEILGKPVCDDESMNFHVLDGSFVDSGDSPVDYLVELIYRAVERGDARIYLQIVDPNAYYDFSEMLDPLLQEVLSSVLRSWSYQWYIYPDSQSFVIDLSY
ncbi:MAG: hypothetical protein E7452_01155 [Ruminococcaceae bacterium]|nr:hypothetical protein [Oscillospiraceae bacterium]